MFIYLSLIPNSQDDCYANILCYHEQHVMLSSKKYQIVDNDVIILDLNRSFVNIVPQFNYLGIILDEHLSWKARVAMVAGLSYQNLMEY